MGENNMARFKRMVVLNTIGQTGLVPIFYNSQFEVAKNIVLACAEGGARAVEFTNRGDRAHQLFSQLAEFCQKELPDVILGVGSIVDAPTAAIYIAAGANFIVGPIFNAEVARLCNRRKIAYMPGCATVTEISAAEEVGVEIVKIFPGGTIGGPDFVKALLGPCPWSSIMATGGVEDTRECLEAWFKTGITCVGMGGNLIQSDRVAASDFQAITAKVLKVINWITEIRQKTKPK
jgi:2-dehydro-3-deoxyphosphogluconate aldolase / (4S)-4-hydroxy-2-oxoglutarate aldolase